MTRSMTLLRGLSHSSQILIPRGAEQTLKINSDRTVDGNSGY